MLWNINLLLFPSTNPEINEKDITFLTGVISFFALSYSYQEVLSAIFFQIYELDKCGNMKAKREVILCRALRLTKFKGHGQHPKITRWFAHVISSLTDYLVIFTCYLIGRNSGLRL